MSVSNSRAVLVGLFLLALGFHAAIVAQDFSTLARNGFLYDDSFYAFKIAHNIANGQGVTFDGVNLTNGFQPLYVFLLVPAYWASGSDLIAPIYVALSLSALLTALTAVLLFGIARRYVSRAIAAISAMLWAFSPVVIRQSVNGLETALALFLFACVVTVYLTRIRSRSNPPRRDFVLLGVLVGLAVLARLDQMFVGLVILLDYLLILRRRHAPARVALDIGRSIVGAFVVYLPWLVYNIAAMGTIFPDSGRATRFLSMAYASFFDMESPGQLAARPSAGFIWANIVHAFSVLKVVPPVHGIFRSLERLGLVAGAQDTFAVVANVLGIVLLAVVVYVLWSRREDSRFRSIAELHFLLLFAVVLMASYSLYVFGVFFFTRYFYPLYFIACIYAAFFLSQGLRVFRARPVAVRSIATVLLVAYVGGFSLMAYSAAFRSQPVYRFYDLVDWVRNNTRRTETIGVFQSGVIGYFSDRKVINLDGKVNRAAFAALKAGTLGKYLWDEGVDVVMDDARVLDIFLGSGDRGESRVIHYDKIMGGSQSRMPGWVAYRISASLDERAGGGGGATEGTSGRPHP